MTKRKPERSIAQLAEDLSTTTDVRERLRLAREIAIAARALEELTVHDARAAGISWTKIGEVYDSSKQAAQQRFRRRDSRPQP